MNPNLTHFSALNPWPVKYSPSAHAQSLGITALVERRALEALIMRLRDFPPPANQFTLRLDLSSGGVQVWAQGGPHLRVRISALYRLTRHECVITHVEVAKP